jgi:acetyl esterase
MPDVARLLRELGVASLEDMRGGLDALSTAVSVRVPVWQVTDGAVDLPGRAVPTRTYRPGPGSRPLLMWFHGGGYVTGTLDAIDPTCRQLALLADVDVVSVGYRLAPEHRYPAGLDDCLLAAERLRPDAVGGDSAGGGLAAVVAQRRTDLKAQVLLCPWLDLSLGLPSVRAYGGSPDGLNETSLHAYAQLYADDPSDPGVSPLHAVEWGRPPAAVIVTAGRDPLRDDGERYGDRLRAAGIPALLRRWEGELHGFPGMTSVTPAAMESLQWVAARLNDLLERRS